MTVTGLNSLAADANLLAGWSSAGIDVKGGGMQDVLISLQVTSASANRQAGTLYVYAYAALDDTPTWPDIFSAGTEGAQGAATVHDTELFGSALKLVEALSFDAGNGDVQSISQRGLAQYFGGAIPPSHVALFITGNIASATNAQLAAAGNSVTYMPVTEA
jgi:hypothetical protein